MTNTLNSISVLILPCPGTVNTHTKSNQLIKPNLRGKGVISLYHMHSYLFKQQYVKLQEKILILEVDFDQYFYLSVQYKINIHLEILVKINPKN